MKDKTKKLLKKGLRLAGAIGLTTLTLGGSFLLGFEVGRATYEKKDETSVSAAKPKSALQPKRTTIETLTPYMKRLNANTNVYGKVGEDFKLPNDVVDGMEWEIQLYGTIKYKWNSQVNNVWQETAYIDLMVRNRQSDGGAFYSIIDQGGEVLRSTEEMTLWQFDIQAYELWNGRNFPERYTIDEILSWVFGIPKEPTEYMKALNGARDLYIRGQNDSKEWLTNNRPKEGKIQIFGELVTTTDGYATTGNRLYIQNPILSITYDDAYTGVTGYNVKIEGGNNYTMDGAPTTDTICEFASLTGYSSIGNTEKPDTILKTIIGRVTEKEFQYVDSLTNWCAMSTNTPYGMSLAEHLTETNMNAPFKSIHATSNGYSKWGVMIGNTYYRVYQWAVRWVPVPSNTQITGFGSAFRPAEDDMYYSCSEVLIYTMEGQKILAKNNYATIGVSNPQGVTITTDGLTDYWSNGGGVAFDLKVKIFNWGGMAEMPSTFENGQVGHMTNFEYLAQNNGYTNWEPRTDWGGDNPTEENVFTLIGGALTGVAGLFAISVLPGITLGTLLLVPFVVTMVVVVIKILRK